jgi:lysophospholipid acyltransferase (LPLAT)-like uncharacterized protein
MVPHKLMASFKNSLKHWSRRPGVRRGLTALTTAHIRLVKATTAWRTVNGSAAEGAWQGKEGVIVAFWHERLALMPYCWPSRAPFHMLISNHPDGQMIAGAVEAFGIATVAGSTTRGGGLALRQLVRKLKNGESVGVTPDGPRGPRRQVGEGVIALARMTGAPILPAAVGTRRRIVLKTWDRLIIGLPFGAGAMVWGERIQVDKGSSDEAIAAARARLKSELDRVSDLADGDSAGP